MEEPYYPHAEAAAHGLSLELLMATSSSTALSRQGTRLSDFAPPTMLGSRLYHRLEPVWATHRCIWVAGPMETVEHLAWAVGLAEHAARDRKAAYILDLDPAQPLRIFASGMGRPLKPEVFQRLSVLGIPAAASWPTDLDGVRIVLPERRGPAGMPMASPEEWLIVIAQPVPETVNGVMAPRPGIDGVIFAAGIRDHTVRELRAAVGTIASARIPMLGMVAMGPVRGAGVTIPPRRIEGARTSPPPPPVKVIPLPRPAPQRAPSVPPGVPPVPDRVETAARSAADVAPAPHPVPTPVQRDPEPPPLATPPEDRAPSDPAEAEGTPAPAVPVEAWGGDAAGSSEPADALAPSEEPAETTEEAPRDAAVPLFSDWHEPRKPNRSAALVTVLFVVLAGAAAALYFLYGDDIQRAVSGWGIVKSTRTPLSTTREAEPAPLDTIPATAPLAASGAVPDTFVVMAASFPNRFDAHGLADSLRALGVDARVVGVQVPELGMRHRVVFGAFATEAQAREEAERVRRQGHVRAPLVLDSGGRAPVSRSLLR